MPNKRWKAAEGTTDGSIGLRDLARQVRDLVSAHPYGHHEPLRLLQDYTSHIELLAGLAEAMSREEQMASRIATLEAQLRQSIQMSTTEIESTK